jgi:hypothetical protein
MKTRIDGKEAVRVAEDMAKPGPIRVVEPREVQEAPGALVPSAGAELDRKVPPRVRKPLPRNAISQKSASRGECRANFFSLRPPSRRTPGPTNTIARYSCAGVVLVWFNGWCLTGKRAASVPQHAPDGRRMDSIGTRDIRLRLAIGKPREGFLTLVGS